MMAAALFLFVAALPDLSPFQVWDIDLLAGEWGETWEEGSAAGSMQYFRIDPDEGAVWVQSYRGEDALHFSFPADGITEDNGLVILTTYPEENFMVRFVVSAYRITEGRGGGLATGYLYMFQKHGDGWMLFNSHPFQGRPLGPDDPIHSHEQLRPFVKQ